MTAFAVQPLSDGGWLLRLPEWSAHEHSVLNGQPAILEPTPDVELQLKALATMGGLDVQLLRRGFRVETRSFVGRVRIGPLTVVVEPKIARASMVPLLRYAFGLQGVKTFDRVAQSAGSFGFEDLLALELFAEVSALVGRGLHRRYVLREEELGSPRGKVDFERLARGARCAATLPCRHHLRLVDTALNRALRMGLALARRVAADRAVRRDLHRLRDQFEEVTDAPLSRATLRNAEPQLDRTTVAYGPALRVTELLLDGTGVTLDDGRRVELDGFLFDMNRFFQALLGRVLREHLVAGGVLEERPLRGMLRWDPGQNPYQRRDPLPRPDFAIRRTNEGVDLLDAKYMDLAGRRPPPDVLYQLAMYALSQDGAGRATILFPGNVERDQVLVVYTPTGGRDQARITIRAVDVECLHGLLTTQGSRRERTRYAARLVLGAAASGV